VTAPVVAPVELEADDSQARAIELICTARLGLITGGPGTGKSTCLRVALDRMPGVKVELAAPTGKASKRMAEVTGREARTIHRLLEYRPGVGFQRDATNPLDAALIIVDEASMLDVELGAALFKAIGPHTRLILVGDANQLPPVGPGQVFADLLRCDDIIPTARLTHIHRSAARSWVNRNAPRVLAGQPIELERTADFEFVEVGPSIDVLGAVRSIVLGDLDAQVLIPQRPGVAGIEAANTLLQSALNPPKDPKAQVLRREKYVIRVGDAVVQTRNDYRLMTFNGECGVVLRIEAGELDVDYPGRPPVTYDFEQARALELAYAMTVHRSQGSEFRHVVAVIHSTHAYLLSRAIAYTAITRTRDRVTIVGDRSGLRHALGNERKTQRNSSLAERLRGELPEVTGA
jgi:exodeoxyribonuclease V alpha subunit